MAISPKKKKLFNNQVKEFKSQIDELDQKIKELKKKQKDKNNANVVFYFNIAIASSQLKKVNIFCQMSDLSMEILGMKNETYLNNGRKEIYNVFMTMEEVLGADMEGGLNSNLDNLKKVHLFNPAQKLQLLQQLSHAIESVVTRFGEKSKWRWSFVEFYWRSAVLIKNIINFREMQRNRDPRAKFYMERLALMRMCKDAMKKASDESRNKYELSTKAPGDMIRAINSLSALRLIHSQFAEKEEAEKLKSGIDILKQRLEKDEKEKEKNKKKSETT